MRTRLERIARALGVVRTHAVEERLDPEAVAAAHEALASSVEDVRNEMLPQPPRRRWSRQARWAAVAAAVLAAATVGIVLAVSGGSKAKPVVVETATTPAATTPPSAVSAAKPHVLPVKAVFAKGQRATFYTVGIEQGGEPVTAYIWSLTPRPGKPACDTFATIPGKPFEAVWHHAATDGCTRRDGTVLVTVLTAHWSCTESFSGTLTGTGTGNAECRRR